MNNKTLSDWECQICRQLHTEDKCPYKYDTTIKLLIDLKHLIILLRLQIKRSRNKQAIQTVKTMKNTVKLLKEVL